MSLSRIRTELEGYKQIFPKGLMNLNLIYNESENYNGIILEQIGRNTSGFVSRDRPKTKDGYTWFWGLNFKTLEGEVQVLFPWAQDLDKKGGTSSDRSIGVYTRGKVRSVEMNQLMISLGDNLSVKLYANSIKCGGLIHQFD